MLHETLQSPSYYRPFQLHVQSNICGLPITTIWSIRKVLQTATDHPAKYPWYIAFIQFDIFEHIQAQLPFGLFLLDFFIYQTIPDHQVDCGITLKWFLSFPAQMGKSIPKDHRLSSPNLSSSILQCIPGAFPVRKVPSFSSWSWRPFFPLQEWITKNLWCYSQTLSNENFLLHTLPSHLSSI